MATVHLVRHAQASFGADDYDCLSALGERQSRLLGEWMRQSGQKVTRVVTGPLRRHLQTAEACLSALGSPPDLRRSALADLRELDHLDVLARYRPEFASAAALRAQLAGAADPHREFQTVFVAALQRWMTDTSSDYAESWSAFKQRCIDALAAIVSDSRDDESIWVFTSGGPIATIVQHVLGIADERMLDLTGTLVNSGLTRLQHRAGRIRLSTYNAHAHLELHADGELITYR